eukprot:scaffold6771_cov158-Amphora_coffeaeformis.AAC.1
MHFLLGALASEKNRASFALTLCKMNSVHLVTSPRFTKRRWSTKNPLTIPSNTLDGQKLGNWLSIQSVPEVEERQIGSPGPSIPPSTWLPPGTVPKTKDCTQYPVLHDNDVWHEI